MLSERRTSSGRRTGPAHRFLAAHRAQVLRVSIITWGELAEHVEHSADLEDILAPIRVLGLPEHVAWQASRIQRELAQPLGENDAWIAGTARSWGFRLVTRDGAFARVPHLRVLNYA